MSEFIHSPIGLWGETPTARVQILNHASPGLFVIEPPENLAEEDGGSRPMPPVRRQANSGIEASVQTMPGQIQRIPHAVVLPTSHDVDRTSAAACCGILRHTGENHLLWGKHSSPSKNVDLPQARRSRSATSRPHTPVYFDNSSIFFTSSSSPRSSHLCNEKGTFPLRHTKSWN
jgi:hypothetical protein